MLLVAHRTPPTAEQCAELVRAGARVFEIDVQLVGGSVVVSHYLPALRVPGWLEYDNWRLRWARRGRPRDPQLAEVVARIPADCAILLDPKEKLAARRAALAQRLIREIADPQRFVVSTPAENDLAEYRAAGFRTWRTIDDARQLAVVRAGRSLPDEAVSVRHSLLDAATVEALHRVVPNVVAWTVNTVERAQILRDMGVDGLTTDERGVMACAAA